MKAEVNKQMDDHELRIEAVKLVIETIKDKTETAYNLVSKAGTETFADVLVKRAETVYQFIKG
jgi:hypothetical protein